MRTPLEIRKSILSALDKRLKDTESASWTQPLSVHLALLSGLADIDEQFFEIGGVPTYVVQQLDEACGDIKQITRTLDGLVTGLADPELVFAVANIVGSGFEPPVPEWALPELYRRAVSDAMRELEARCDEADPRLAQLEQLLSAVLGRAQGIHSSKPSAQTDDDGWGDEMALDDVLGPSPYEERMQETREVLRSVLSSAMSEISPLPVPLKMLALRTIQKYFVTQGQESSDLRVFGQATLVQHIWGIQIPASELGDPAQHEATLTQLMAESSTEQHVLGMAQLLAVWFEPEDGSLDTAAEALWMSLFTWAIDAGFDRLVFQIILKMRTKARIHDEMLLDKIQGSRDIVDFHRFALISMSSIVVDSMLSSLLDQIADSADFQELLFTSKNLLLLVLAHGYGPMLARLNLNWTKLCETLLVNTSGATEHSTALQRQFVAVLAADLVAAGSIFRASRLTQIYFSASSLLHAGPQADFILLRQLVALGAESAGVPFHVHTIPLSFAQDQAVPKFHASSDSLDVPSDDDAVLSHFLLDGGNALQQRFREKLGTALEILNGFIESF
nr:hypothetical protein HK105_002448 [Polyrhizophydium stewartii]